MTAIDIGAKHSQLFRAMVDRLNDSDVIVHIVYDATSRAGMVGHLTFATTVESARYVRVSVSRQLVGYDLVAIIGHELQHAAEIASEPVVRDRRSMAAFYRKIGIRRDDFCGEAFDTADAVEMGRRIRREVAATAWRRAAEQQY